MLKVFKRLEVKGQKKRKGGGKMKKMVFSVASILLVASADISLSSANGPVPDTGQTQSYTNTFGEDSDYTINPQSYTKLDSSGNALSDSATSWSMVKDNLTGLIWEVKTPSDGIEDFSNPHDADNAYTWYDSNSTTNGGDAGTPGDDTDTEDFVNALNSSNFGGFSDWRLPTTKELSWIVNRGTNNPAINTDYFGDTMSLYSYWSSTTLSGKSGVAGWVSFYSGSVYNRNKKAYYYVRAVRGGQAGSLDPFVDNGDGTVTDTSTGLMWQQATAGQMNWEEAIAYCESLSLAGHSDWRLPDCNELQSVVDYSTNDPAINTDYFPDTLSLYYWSSTTWVGGSAYAWRVYFGCGSVGGSDKTFSYYVRAVRGGQ